MLKKVVLHHPPNRGTPRRAFPNRGRSERNAEAYYFTLPPHACRDKLFTRGRYVGASENKARKGARLGEPGAGRV